MEEQMNEQPKIEKTDHRHDRHGYYGHSGDAVYGLGLIGAAIFYISRATSFWPGVLGFLKAIVWPVFFVYDALKFLAK